MSREHEHNYVAEKYAVQELERQYTGNRVYKTAIIENERVLLFCTKCGHKIDHDTTNKTEEVER